MRGLVAVLLAVITGMFCSFVTYLPEIGDVNNAPNQHVTPSYISRSVEDPRGAPRFLIPMEGAIACRPSQRTAPRRSFRACAG